MSTDDELRATIWAKMQQALDDTAREYRRTADELNRIEFDDAKGRRSPDSIISQAALTAYTNTASTMTHRLASWAQALNEIDRRVTVSPTCGYSIDDPHTICVLAPGHGLPTDDGLVVHVSADGVMFA